MPASAGCLFLLTSVHLQCVEIACGRIQNTWSIYFADGYQVSASVFLKAPALPKITVREADANVGAALIGHGRPIGSEGIKLRGTGMEAGKGVYLSDGKKLITVDDSFDVAALGITYRFVTLM